MTDSTDWQPRAVRPRFPRGYGISSEPAGLLDWSWAVERLTAARNYWVCTVSSDARPHAAPVWGVWRDCSLYFSTDPTSRKGDNLAARGDITVHLESGDEVVIIDGAVRRIAKLSDVEWLAPAYEAKYGVDVTTFPEKDSLWLAVEPRIVRGWRETDFPTSATRWVFDVR